MFSKRKDVKEEIYNEMERQLNDEDIEKIKAYDDDYARFARNMSEMAKAADTLEKNPKQNSIGTKDILQGALYIGGILAVLMFESNGNILHSKALTFLSKKIF